jgi:hypothetical protein
MCFVHSILATITLTTGIQIKRVKGSLAALEELSESVRADVMETAHLSRGEGKKASSQHQYKNHHSVQDDSLQVRGLYNQCLH